MTWPDGTKSEVKVHRLAFMKANNMIKGEIPSHDGHDDPLDVSHLCHNKLCMNVAHLVLESRATNNDRKHCWHLHRCSGQHEPHCVFQQH